MRTISILVVEDNDADTFYLKTVLDKMGLPFSMSVLTDGESAVNFVLKRGEYRTAPSPDLIFLDLVLPKLSGLGVLEALERCPALSYCIVTGSALEREEIRKRFGIRRIAYVMKPVNRELILNCFRCYEHLAPLAEQVAVGNPH